MTAWMVATGAVLGLVAVAAGAFAAHALEGIPERYLNAFKVAAQYQMYHALALILVGLMPACRSTAGAAWCFVAGVSIFSGSLYLLALTRIGWLGAITPIGGVLFLVGWGLVAWAAISRQS
jgi:uncharacterized membrane protein YgdD (TMEM256/DUF423 family)